ncbi:MAG TPA: prolyl oligopeptidase family serine peptidase [Thermoanaerobaculia bacterium]|nr:prolyl oligopeptidase family serine peptidase [Thermoanaerobaculia bacterium]
MESPVEHATATEERIVYPESARVEQVDDYHGVKVADPYRWLEDLDSDRTHGWVTAQNQVTTAYLAAIPEREPIRKRLTELWNYERYGVPAQHGGRYFFTRNDGLQNQNVVYRVDSLSGEPKVVLDPNLLSQDGTVALSGMGLSEDGKMLAYSLSSGGSDWQEWHVREVETGRDLPDVLKWVKFSTAAWTHDNKGFFYSRYDEPREGRPMEDANFFQKLYYHRLGTPQSADELIFQRPDSKEMGFVATVTEDGRYLIIQAWRGTETDNGILYKDLQDPKAPVVELMGRFDASYNFIENDGPVFWFETDLAAPRSRVIAVDVRQPEPEHWREVIPQAAETLQAVSCLHDSLVALYLKDAHSEVRRFDLTGKSLGELKLPGLGAVEGFTGRRKDRETFYSFASYTTPGTIYRYDLETGKSTVFRRPEIRGFDPNQYETKQVFYPSKDGTKIPMFLTYKKGLKLDGSNPTYLYGYGGFSVALTPAFSLSHVVWMERGGVYAVANLRGGSEYGEDWHQAGIKLRKQNVFDDFTAAGEWLIANGYTSRHKLAIAGYSNGGLLTAACMVQRPDLYGAVIVGVGVLDMLRFHKFTIGWGWTSDYGSPDNPEEFKALYAYSPYHNLKPGTAYPPTLITTADHDDRVVPAHSFKFAAALQRDNSGPNPTLIRIETRAGHGGGKPVSKKIEEAADELTFLSHALGRPAAVKAAGAAAGEGQRTAGQ